MGHWTLIGSRRGREPKLPNGLLNWLRLHPQAWAGWPTSQAADPQDLRARVARLEAAGCLPALLRSSAAVHHAIAVLRAERRERYIRQVERACPW